MNDTAMKKHLVWSWLAAVTLFAIFAAVVVNLWVVPTSFEAKASTEYARIHIDSSADLKWHFDHAMLRRETGGPEAEFTGDFRPAPQALVTVERIASGPLHLQISAPDGSASAGEFGVTGDAVQHAGTQVFFRLDKIAEKALGGQTLVLPFLGRAEIGSYLGFSAGPPMPVLRACTLRLLGQTLIGGYLFDAGSKELDRGDYLTFAPSHSAGVGFLMVDNDPALTLVYRVIGDAALVTRLGSQGYGIRTSLYSRIVSDTSLQLIWAATLAFTWGLKLVPTNGSKQATAAVILVVLYPVPGTAEVVNVSAETKGTGVTRQRGLDCFVITPNHLLGDNKSTATVVGPKNNKAQATLARPYKKEDVAILRIDSPDATSFCKEPWAEPVDLIYANLSDWRAESALSDGSPSVTDLTFADWKEPNLSLKPRTATVQLFAGLSGSIVHAGNQTAGMLFDVVTTVKPNIAIGYSWRHLNALVSEFFEQTADWKELPQPDGKPVQSIEVFNGKLMAGTNGGGVYAFEEATQKWTDISDGIRGRKLLCLHATGVILLATFDSYGTNTSGYAISDGKKLVRPRPAKLRRADSPA